MGVAEGMTRDYIAIAAQYQARVLDGSLPACKWVRLACERNRRDLDRQGSGVFPYRFDPEKARRICSFAELLPHTKGPKAQIVGQDDEGKPLWATLSLEPWQCWLLTTLFGWIAETGLRRFRVALILVPRKNGKSVVGAIIALYMLTEAGESGSEVYSAATTRDQAKVVAEIAWEMAKRSPQFREFYGVKLGSVTMRSLAVPALGSKFAPLSADANSLDGLNVSCAVIDELHAHKNRGVWDVLDTATGARMEPLLAAITTAGIEVGGICHEKLGYLEKVLDGVAVDESFFGVNYTIDAGDDIRTLAVQQKANPNHGVSVQAEDLERKVLEAQHSQAALNNVLTKHFNVWIRTESSWMSATTWQSCTKTGLTWEALREYPCWIGIDLGEVRDYSAVVLVFQTGPDAYAVVPFIYVPEDAIALSPIAALSGWVREGGIIVTPGSEADYQRIEDDLIEWVGRLNVQELDFDRRSARLMIQGIRRRLEPSMGRDKAELFAVDVPQSIETMDPAMKMAERLVTGKRLVHDGNNVMAWMVSNLVIERNHKDEIYPRKAGGKDSHNKIDAPVAFFTALSRAIVGIQTQTFQMFVLGGR